MPESGEYREPSNIFSTTLKDLNSYGVAVLAALGTAGAVILAFREAFEGWQFDFYESLVLIVVSVSIVGAWVIFPRWQESRRQKRVIPIGESYSPSNNLRFTTDPRSEKDRETFQRADHAHEKVLSWIVNASDSVLFLTGRSGVGKSSLLSAFVIPELKTATPKFEVLQVRSYGDPMQAMVDALNPGSVSMKVTQGS